MEDFPRQLQTLSEQCLSLEVEDQLMASEIRFNRQQLQEDYDILVNADEGFQFKRIYLLKYLLDRRDEENVSTSYKKQLHCLSDVVEDQSTPFAIYTKEHFEEDYKILVNAFKDLQENKSCLYHRFTMGKSDREDPRTVQTGQVQDLFVASEIKFTRQQLTEDHDTLIRTFKDLQEKHAHLFIELSVRKVTEDKDLTNSKKHWLDKNQRNLCNDDNCESVMAETRKPKEVFDTLISAFKDLQAKQLCLSEQEKQEDIRKQHDKGLSDDKYYKSMMSEIKLMMRCLDKEHKALIYAFKQLQTKACLLDWQMFVYIRPEGNNAGFKEQQRNEFQKGLSEESHQELCLSKVTFVRKELDKDYDALITTFKDFQARQAILLGEQMVKHLKQRENHAGPRRQYRTEYERGLSNIVKERWLQAEIPDLDRKIDQLINARKNLPVEAASWLEELCNRQDMEEVADFKKQMYNKYQKDVYKVEKVQLPHDVHPELERTIEHLVTARKNLKKEEVCFLEKLASGRVEEEVPIVSKKQYPSNGENDHLPHAVNTELETAIELLIQVRQNLEECVC